MVDAERETMFLPPKERLAEQTSAFEEMKKELAGVKQQADKEEKDRPSLLLPEKGCPVPQQTEYKPGMPIESVCPSQETQPAPATKTSQKTKRGPDEHPGSSTTKTTATRPSGEFLPLTQNAFIGILRLCAGASARNDRVEMGEKNCRGTAATVPRHTHRPESELAPQCNPQAHGFLSIL